MIRRGRSLALLIAVCCCGCHDQAALQQTEHRGTVIVHALEAFHETNGCYPKTLEQLVPEHLAEIPGPVWGQRVWIYEPCEDQFTLGVNESARTGDGISHYLIYVPGQGWMGGD